MAAKSGILKTSLRGLVAIVCLSLLFGETFSRVANAYEDEIAEQATSEEYRPHWIWSSSDGTLFKASKVFSVDGVVVATQLRFAPMSARVEVSLDDGVVAAVTSYGEVQSVELPSPINLGDHVLSIQAQGVQGPSAVFVELELEYADGRRQLVLSDGSWTAIGSQLDDLGAVSRKLVVHPDRRVGIGVLDNYEQWKQAKDARKETDPTTFSITEGFEIELIRSAKKSEDSWVSMAFDPEGRIVIAMEKTGLLRMTLSDDATKVTRVQKMDRTLEECRGLAFVGNDLFANANDSKGMYRLRDAEFGYEKPELLLQTNGEVGHGRNDLAIGFGDTVNSIHGDSVDLPRNLVKDFTSPFREARQGLKTKEGHWIRMNPRTGDVELLAAGLRNPFGIDFNRDGEAFTYDADAEYDMGAPWYRPTRISHLMIGADYGWRGVTKSWPSYYPDHPDNTLSNFDVGKGSPTAVKFGTRSNFPAPFKDSLFILDWAYGRILAVNMVPRGSSYLMTAETFLKGRPLNVTDLDFGPNGDMYFVTGGRKTKSALYRVRFVGETNEKSETSSFEKSVERFATNSRRLRRELEGKLGTELGGKELLRAWKLLGANDPWIRRTAANLVEHQRVSKWSERALQETDPRKAVIALSSLARSGKSEFFPKIVRRLNALVPKIQLPSERLHAYYTYWLCLRDQQPLYEDFLLTETRTLLNAEYPAQSNSKPSYPHNRLLSELLVLLGSPDVVEKTIGLLNGAANQTEQMHYLYVLRNVSNGWTMDQRRDFFSSLRQTRFYLGGAGMPDFINRIREEAVATLSDEEKEKLGDLIDAEPTTDETVATEPRNFVRKWTVVDVLSDVGLSERNAERGAKVFAEASCIKCHRFGSRGTLIGPDLTSAFRRFNAADMLTSILEPSKVVAENYRTLQIVKSNGKTLTGQPTAAGDYRSPVLRIATDPNQPFKTEEVEKNDIESQKWSDVSWMPEGLVDTFTQDEILDLLHYLQVPIKPVRLNEQSSDE